MKNRLHVRLVIVAIVFYLYVAFYLAAAESWGLFIGAGIYVVVVMTLAHSLVVRDFAKAKADKHRFKRNYPLRHFGSSVGNFQHVFFYQKSILNELIETISKKMVENEIGTPLSRVEYTDADKHLVTPETKSFHVSTAAPTLRGTTVTVAIHTSELGTVQSVMWWVLQHGLLDRNRVFRFVVFAPVTIFFWIVPYLSRRYDLLNKVRTTPPSFFNDIDLQTSTRAFHETIYDTLVEILDKHGIDTSDLKLQRAQIMNINVSGGQTTFGSILQGGVNRLLQRQQTAPVATKA